MLLRARRRGEIGPKADLQLAQDLFGGPLDLRRAILGEEYPGLAEQLADAGRRHKASRAMNRPATSDRVGVGAAQSRADCSAATASSSVAWLH